MGAKTARRRSCRENLKTTNMLRARTGFLALVAVFLAAAGAQAAETAPMETLVEEAKAANPEILALKQKFNASRRKITIARTWDYPFAGYEKNDRAEMLSVSQMFPFPGKTYLAGRAATHESKVVQKELEAKTREVAGEIKKNYWRWWLAHKTIGIYRQNVDLMTRFLEIAKTRYASGRVTQSDVLKANTELAKMESAIILLEQKKLTARYELNSLLMKPPETPLGEPSQPTIKRIDMTAEELSGLALGNNPDIMAKESSRDKFSSEADIAKLQWLPDIMGQIKSDSMGERTYMAGASVPLYFWKQTSAVGAAGDYKEAARWEIETARIATLRKIHNLAAKYDAHFKIAIVYDSSIVPLAEQTLTVAESGYRSGKTDFLDLLDAQRNYLGHNIDYYTHLTESQIYLADLEKTAGTDF